METPGCGYPGLWRPLVVEAPGCGDPWLWRPLVVDTPGCGDPWLWRPLGNWPACPVLKLTLCKYMRKCGYRHVYGFARDVVCYWYTI